ncbi:hypothetical protein RRG08_040865 [Elysia crispata]|uniref:Uncharacterized protein n=1 Tax=Elysia crispata TaxID=231223 RepID=A0AAE1AZ47_9GAST|nr:hypothetical protein RRG08_040865 [Elysia crispata]
MVSGPRKNSFTTHSLRTLALDHLKPIQVERSLNLIRCGSHDDGLQVQPLYALWLYAQMIQGSHPEQHRPQSLHSLVTNFD